MACLTLVALLASCKKDVEPKISATAGPGTTIYAGETVTVGFAATGQNLTKIEMNASQNGIVLYNHSTTITSADSYNYTHTFTVNAAGTVTITGIVTDAKGNTASTNFDITCNEKPNAKFVGKYEGEALVTGNFDINVSGMDPMHEDFTDRPFATVVEMTEGDEMTKVNAAITLNDQTNTVVGTVDGNKVVFEAINDTYTMNYEYQGFSIPIELDMTYNIVGTLVDGQLQLSGTCKGSGDINMFVISGTFEMEGTVGGSLTKTE